jgi:hypothetical protein
VAKISFFSLIANGAFSTCAQMMADSTSSLDVYINCASCYQNYLKTQITWVNFVQDQFVSDVDLTITALSTGSGGSQYQLVFSGKKELAGLKDTMQFVTNAINTVNEIREMLSHKVKLGLVRYAACGSAADILKIESTNDRDSVDIGIGSNPEEDKWNAWVFRLGVSGNADAQRANQKGYFRGSISGSQVKETHKLLFGIEAIHDEQRFVNSGTFILRSQRAYLSYVHSINNHWSAGGFMNSEISDFSNYDLYQNVSAGLEYNVFPYQKAQTKLMTFAYQVGYSYYDFQEETIFNKTVERILANSLNISTSFTKDWGRVNAGVEVASFLNDFQKKHLSLYSEFEIRIFKGLSANGFITSSIQRDQINIRLKSSSEAQVLLQQQELLSDYRLYARVGLNYRFGSIYNNVVNPRFN